MIEGPSSQEHVRSPNSVEEPNLEQAKYNSIVDLLNPRYRSDEEVRQLAETFKREHIVHLQDVFPKPLFSCLKYEAVKLSALETHREFTMRGYNTPRLMGVVNAPKIIEHSKLLWTLYSNHHLFNLIQSVVGTELFPSRHPTAFMALNHLRGVGSTQGWHLDDGAFAVVYAFKVPKPGDGGVLEYTSNWIEFCKELGTKHDENVDVPVQEARKRGLIKELSLGEGDCYILRSDTSLHRVSEMLSTDSDRLVLAVGYEDNPNTIYTHTGTDLYAPEETEPGEKNYEMRKESESKGEGVFATRPFKRGDTVIIGRIEKYLDANTSHASQIGKNVFVLHSQDQQKINHSCSPNCGIKVNETGAHDIVAMKDVALGDEITIDYAMRNYDVEFFPAQCHCGSSECRGHITGWKDLPEAKKAEYAGYVAPYLLEL